MHSLAYYKQKGNLKAHGREWLTLLLFLNNVYINIWNECFYSKSNVNTTFMTVISVCMLALIPGIYQLSQFTPRPHEIASIVWDNR